MRYSPWDHLESLPHITFGITRLPHGQGWWLPDMEAIALDSRLDRVERRCVLAHELVHAERQDRNCQYEGPDGGRQARRQELHADRVSSARLVDVVDLVDALRAHPYDPDLVAEQLDVTPDALRARLQSLTDDQRTEIEASLVAFGVIRPS